MQLYVNLDDERGRQTKKHQWFSLICNDIHRHMKSLRRDRDSNTSKDNNMISHSLARMTVMNDCRILIETHVNSIQAQVVYEKKPN